MIKKLLGGLFIGFLSISPALADPNGALSVSESPRGYIACGGGYTPLGWDFGSGGGFGQFQVTVDQGACQDIVQTSSYGQVVVAKAIDCTITDSQFDLKASITHPGLQGFGQIVELHLNHLYNDDKITGPDVFVGEKYLGPQGPMANSYGGGDCLFYPGDTFIRWALAQ